jgi:hypothetical protein
MEQSSSYFGGLQGKQINNQFHKTTIATGLPLRLLLKSM